ncbi:MAG: AarF/ABC1/UbiB kinase family protein [Coriobacteriia bacterium]|nr:AarF/ABC1/UbiB kinase family protein [Coriobacteriia bacterium]
MSRGPGASPDVRKHLARHRQIASVLADEGLHAVIDATGLHRVAPPRYKTVRGASKPDTLTREQHVRRALERLGPSFIKAGQAISTRTDVIPPELAKELRKLQDQVPAEPFEVVRQMVETELEMGLEEAFATFDPECAAAASLGQVHWATLFDGTEVAVKVQRPEARHQMEIDVDIALTQARWVSEHTDIFGNTDILAVSEEFAEAVLEELDYSKEARNAERLWRAFKDDPTVAFPKVYWERTTSRVLTLERLYGISMNRVDALDEAGLDRVELAQRGINCFLKQMFEIGFFHADPHPGNYLALADGRVGFTDFGRVGTISEESRERFVDLVWGAVNRDPQMATDTLVAMSGNPEVDEVVLGREVARLIGKYHGLELGGINFGELMSETLGLIRGHQLGVPSDFALLISTLGILEGVGTMLDPSFDFASTAKPFADKIVQERLRPDVIIRKASSTFRHTLRVLEMLPDATERVLRRVSRGEVRVAVRPTGYEDMLSELHELVNRLAFALVVAALVIGFSTLLSVSGAPGWSRMVGEVGMVLAFVVSGWFFISIWLSHRRHKNR